jgi:hypothetical protein
MGYTFRPVGGVYGYDCGYSLPVTYPQLMGERRRRWRDDVQFVQIGLPPLQHLHAMDMKNHQQRKQHVKMTTKTRDQALRHTKVGLYMRIYAGLALICVGLLCSESGIGAIAITAAVRAAAKKNAVRCLYCMLMV